MMRAMTHATELLILWSGTGLTMLSPITFIRDRNVKQTVFLFALGGLIVWAVGILVLIYRALGD